MILYFVFGGDGGIGLHLEVLGTIPAECSKIRAQGLNWLAACKANNLTLDLRFLPSSFCDGVVRCPACHIVLEEKKN